MAKRARLKDIIDSPVDYKDWKENSRHWSGYLKSMYEEHIHHAEVTGEPPSEFTVDIIPKLIGILYDSMELVEAMRKAINDGPSFHTEDRLVSDLLQTVQDESTPARARIEKARLILDQMEKKEEEKEFISELVEADLLDVIAQKYSDDFPKIDRNRMMELLSDHFRSIYS